MQNQTALNRSVMSPPPKRFHLNSTQKQQERVRNPFESALADRLHLPFIASPSLFQRPATPQLSSTQFEWTIEDVSSLKPAHVEPHETQFQDSPDPEYEAKAQSAISSFFKEHQIVPSPVNCSIQQQRIILAEINSNTPIGKPGRRIRDFGTQTALTLPVELPPALEEALRPYFQPHLAGCYAEDGAAIPNLYDSHERSSSSSSVQSGGGGAHNMSMRRKLFDMHNIMIWDENQKSHTPRTPRLHSPQALVQVQQRTPLPSIAGKLSDSLEKSDLLSPISGSDCLSGSPHSPQNLHATTGSDGSQNSNSALKSKNIVLAKKISKTKQRRRSSLFNPSDAELSPIYPSPPLAMRREQKDSACQAQVQSKDFVTPAKVRKTNCARRRLTTAAATPSDAATNQEDDDDYDMETNSAKFTPDRSSSPLHSCHSSGNHTECAANTIATESFHQRISRLVVNSAKSLQQPVGKLKAAENLEMLATDGVDDDEAMQLSQLSVPNSNLSSSSINSHCDTPTGKRRSASRKNLSQSFTANWQLEDYEDDTEDEQEHADADKAAFDEKAEILLPANSGAIAEQAVSGVLKADLPEITDLLAQQQTQQQQLQQQHSNIQQQQRGVNFYRTDSGFNEMTTSSYNSNGLLVLSQQDELSREAFTFKTIPEAVGDTIVGEDIDEHIARYCSTPSRPPPNEYKLNSNASSAINKDL